MKTFKSIWAIVCVFSLFIVFSSEAPAMKSSRSPLSGNIENVVKPIDSRGISRTLHQAIDRQIRLGVQRVAGNKVKRKKLNQQKTAAAGTTEQSVQEMKIKKLRERLPDLEVKLNKKNWTPIFIKAKRLLSKSDAVRTLAAKGKSSEKVKARDIALSALHEYRDLLKISDPFEEFDRKQEIPDSLGLKHVKLQQFYKGIPVWGKEMIVHLDKEDTVYLIEGRITPTPVIDTSPAISRYDAMDKVLRDFEETPDLTGPELVIHIDRVGIKRLTYHIEVHAGYRQWQYFVDAKTGAVIEKYNDTKTESAPASGADLFGQTRNFHAWHYGGAYYTIDTSFPMHTVDPSIADGNPGAGNIVIIRSDNRSVPNDEQNTPDISNLYWLTSSYTNSGWDSTGISALYGISAAENYFRNTFNRNSFDDKGSGILGVIHVGDEWKNACWTGTGAVLFGDESDTFKPLAKGLDVVSHEFTHAVTQYSANLEYQYQSGALNEAFSDIFACMVDRDDWIMGEDVVKIYPYCLRSFIDPHSCMDNSPATMDEYENLPNTENGDNGGVHVNAVIPGRTAYFVAEGLTQQGIGTSIGREKTEHIYYRALTMHLTKQSDFYQARLATIQSAEELYGAGSTEVNAVKAAWDIVGVLENNGGGTGETPPVQGSDNLLFIYPYYAALYLGVYLSSGELYQVSSTPVSETKPVVVEDGTLVLFVDALNNLRLATLPPDSPEEYSITNNGSIRTIGGSQDGHYFAFTTTAYDNLLYVLDMTDDSGQNDRIFELYSPTDSNDRIPIDYADVIDFDLSGKRVVFDALNEIKLTGAASGYQYWNIGILDMKTGQIQMLVPPLPEGTHIGNPATANTKDWLIAMDIINENEQTYQTVAVNLVTSDAGLIAEEDYFIYPTIGRPAFDGDDASVSMEYQDLIIEVPIIKNGDTFSGDFANAVGLLQGAYMPRFYRVGARDVKPNIQVSKISMGFGSVTIGQTATDTVTIQNTGNYDLTIDSLQISGSGEFTENGTHATVAPGASIYITVAFKPLSAGPKGATFAIGSDDPDTPVMNISLSGTGVSQSGTGEASLSPVYLFWSTIYGHFFTIHEDEKNYILTNWSDTWDYVGVAFYAYTTQVPGTSPVYLFWSTLYGHFFTIHEDEKNYILANWADDWDYVGVSFYAYTDQVPDTSPVYLFWSTLYGHYFTIHEDEKDYILANWSDVWDYVGVAYYAYTSAQGAD